MKRILLRKTILLIIAEDVVEADNGEDDEVETDDVEDDEVEANNRYIELY